MNSTLLPISPAVTSSPQSTLDVQRSLFQLCTLDRFDPVRPVLKSIERTVRPLTENRSPGGDQGLRLRYLSHLLGTDPVGSSQALAEIASRSVALKALAASPEVRTLLGQLNSLVQIETGPVQEGIREWYGGPAEPISASSSPGLWGQMNYWLGNVMGPLKPISGIALTAGLGHALATGDPSVGWLAATGTLLGAGLVTGHQRRGIAEEMIRLTEQGGLNKEKIMAYFDAFQRPFGSVSPFPTDDDVVASIRRSAVGGGTPHLDRLATLQTIADFLNLGTVGTLALQKDPSGVLYDRIAQAIGLGVLNRLKWQPIVLHADRLRQLEELKGRGKKIIKVSNHRSHLDILKDVALLRNLRTRMVAKKSLGRVPVLGLKASHHPFQPWLWYQDSILGGAGHVLVDRKSPGAMKRVAKEGATLLGKGLTPFFYAEGSRMATPVRTEEVGMMPFEQGAFYLAAQFPEDAVIAASVSYGFGRILPKDVGQAVREGVMIDQPTVTSYLEPIEVREVLGRNSRTPDEAAERLNAFVWHRMWHELSAIQATMNHATAHPSWNPLQSP